jgi:hypothetical protein
LACISEQHTTTLLYLRISHCGSDPMIKSLRKNYAYHLKLLAYL